MEYNINKLAKLANISVRTLHYYDQINLLKPSYTKENGYRVYTKGELVKLQEILFLKELEFPLKEIRGIMNNVQIDKGQILKDQMNLLRMKRKRLDKLITTIHSVISSKKGGINMSNDDMYQSFSNAEIEKYKKEAKERWGNTKEYKQSIERTKNWKKEDFKKIAEDNDDIARKLVENIDNGIESKEVQEQIQRAYDNVNKFYDCSYELFRNLGKMYRDDERFAKRYRSFDEHLPDFICRAIEYFCNSKINS